MAKAIINDLQRVAWVIIFIGAGVLAVYVFADIMAEGALLWIIAIWLYATVLAYGLGEVVDWAFKLSRNHDEPVVEILLDAVQRLIWLVIWTLGMFWVDMLLARAIGVWMLPVSLFVWLGCGFGAWACATVTSWATVTLADLLK